MNKPVPRFDPPTLFSLSGNFADRFRVLEKYVLAFRQYLVEWMDSVVAVLNTGFQGYSTSDVASATTISIGSRQTKITGTAAIQTILVEPGFSGQIALISANGFSLTTGGNIAKAVSVPAGSVVLLEYYPPDGLWYPVLGV